MIRTTLSFTALFGLLAIACNLLFTNAQQRAASGRQVSPAEVLDEKCGEEIREAKQKDSPLSLLSEPAPLKRINARSAKSEIQLVDFEEIFFQDPDEAVDSLE